MPTTYIVIITAVVLFILSWTTYHYHSLYQEGVVTNKVLLDKNKELLANLNETNLSIDKLAKESADREVAAKKALADSERKFREYVKYSTEILISKPVDKDMCVSADDLFNKYIERK